MEISLIKINEIRKELEVREKMAKEIFHCNSYVPFIFDKLVKVQIDYREDSNSLRKNDSFENVIQINTVEMGDLITTEIDYITPSGFGSITVPNENIKSLKIYN